MVFYITLCLLLLILFGGAAYGVYYYVINIKRKKTLAQQIVDGAEEVMNDPNGDTVDGEAALEAALKPRATAAPRNAVVLGRAAEISDSDWEKFKATIDTYKYDLMALPIHVASEFALKYVLKRVFGYTEHTGKYLKYVAKGILKLGVRILEKMGIKVGEKMLARLGIKAAQSVATKVGQSTLLAAASGPAFPFVEAALLVFDVLSLALDIGDPGGYNKMQTKQAYREIQKGIVDAFNKTYADNGITGPIIVGPMDKLTGDELQTSLVELTKKIVEVPGNKYLKPVLDAVKAKLAINPQMTSAELEAVVDAEADKMDFDGLIAEAFSTLCGRNDGVMQNDKCMYRTKKACDESYTWPLQKDDTYVEWKDNKCVIASQGMRGVCDQNGMAYNSETGICDVNEEYCKRMGADWVYNDAIKEYDCSINTGQSIAEAIFGTTIVRGLKQIFDPAQYEKCKPGEIDDGYFCRLVKCKDDEDADGGFCYPKCKAGYHAFGCCVCTPDCPQGWTDDGAFCRQTDYCGPGKDNQGAMCYDKCPAGYSGALDWCRSNCPPGYVDDGLLCRNPLSTYGRGVGKIPNVGCPSSHPNQQGVGTASWCDNGPRWDFWNLRTTSSVKTCQSGYELKDGLCYPKCRDGYTADGCCICRKGGDVIAKTLKYRGVGTPDTSITAKGPSYGRGVGNARVTVRAKKRIVPYGTKDN